MKRPNGPRNLKAGGFTNAQWRLEERERLIQERRVKAPKDAVEKRIQELHDKATK
jgi:hypothetical protein